MIETRGTGFVAAITNDSASVDFTVTDADLAITKGVSDSTPDENDSIDYTVTVTNNGPDGATGVVVTDLLPAGVAYDVHLASQGTYVPGTGEWTVGRECVVLDRAGGSIAYRFHARDAHLVLSSGAGRSIPFRVLLDGQAPGAAHGLDVDEDGQGVLRDGRLYQLVRQDGEVRERTAEITFLEPGAEAYVFTFG